MIRGTFRPLDGDSNIEAFRCYCGHNVLYRVSDGTVSCEPCGWVAENSAEALKLVESRLPPR